MALGLDLQELIAIVEGRAAADALARVEAAAGASEELTETADALLTHFVGAARGAGASWTEIGGALGVTKQGAQQRFAFRTRALLSELVLRGQALPTVELPWLERFTVRARRSITTAADEARRLNHEDVGTEHLLLGLLGEHDGLAVAALEVCGHKAEEVRAALTARLHPGTEPPADGGSFAPGALRALDRTMGEAVRLGHNYIGTEHILLGLLKEEEGLAAETLRGLGITHDQLSVTVVGLLAGRGKPG